MKDSITAIEYTSGGAFVRNVSAETTKSDVKNLSVSVSRKSGTSNVLKNYIAIGYNYSSTAKIALMQLLILRRLKLIMLQ